MSEIDGLVGKHLVFEALMGFSRNGTVDATKEKGFED